LMNAKCSEKQKAGGKTPGFRKLMQLLVIQGRAV
jgi:hypothetical protein